MESSAAKGYVMMTIPDIMRGLKIDRRKAENSVLLLAKGKNPKLEEIIKGRVKYYVLKQILEFAREMWGEEK